MEKKTKHRILGLLVLIGLVVILLPFFQGEKEFSTETTLVKAPPFPDQSMQAMASDPSQPDDEELEPVVLTASAQQSVPARQPAPVAQSAPAEQISVDTVNQQPETAVSKAQNQAREVSPPVINKKDFEQSVVDENDDSGTQLGDDVIQVNKSENVAQKTTISLPAKITKNNGLIAIKNAVWVIQLGSFKDKSNALRLVNRLRSNGYPAFIQKVATAFGEHTRVYVGPESKKDSAKALADKLDNDFHLHGIIVSYKPLTL